ncbi:hypothetical protein [Cryobacterium sp. CAN_C2]|uniref:hypothetical protein n=1 Tax=Cryobacterium sp. CAN_C2 TaxID=2787723 RepID=UPI0018CA23E7
MIGRLGIRRVRDLEMVGFVPGNELVASGTVQHGLIDRPFRVCRLPTSLGLLRRKRERGVKPSVEVELAVGDVQTRPPELSRRGDAIDGAATESKVHRILARADRTGGVDLYRSALFLTGVNTGERKDAAEAQPDISTVNATPAERAPTMLALRLKLILIRSSTTDRIATFTVCVTTAIRASRKLQVYPRSEAALKPAVLKLNRHLASDAGTTRSAEICNGRLSLDAPIGLRWQRRVKPRMPF